MTYSGPPLPTVEVPAVITELAGGRPLVPVWQNQTGGLTYRIGGEGEAYGGPDLRGDAPRDADGGPGTGADADADGGADSGADGGGLYAKWAPAGSGQDLGVEAERLRWAGRFTTVPRVRDHGADARGAWLVTYALPGENAVTPRWRADPATAVRALGAGLRALHDRLPVADCPFTWSVADRLRQARAAGLEVPRDLADPAAVPPHDLLVVCHGDPCAPNTLLGPDGAWTGHVDMGSLGTADRWADLAVALWSADLNYGPGWHDAFLDAYGIAPDPERTAFYRGLWLAT